MQMPIAVQMPIAQLLIKMERFILVFIKDGVLQRQPLFPAFLQVMEKKYGAQQRMVLLNGMEQQLSETM